MKTIAILLLLIVLFPSFCFSGEIYGCIKEGRKFIKERAKVEINYENDTESTKINVYSLCNLYAPEKGTCILKMYYRGQTTPYFILFSLITINTASTFRAGEIYDYIVPDVSTETDKYGTYSLYVPKEGNCLLKVHYKGQTTQDFRVRSYESSVQYDFLLEIEDGKYCLRSK